MEARNAEGARQLDGPPRHRKRQRSSSTSSYLEPAVFDHLMAGAGDDTRKRRNSHGRQQHSINTKHERHQESPTSESDGSSESQATLAQQSCLYERRPRHKTKEDRYELKQEKERKRPKKDKNKSTRRQSRSAKTGASLLHDFRAKNVASERLTLRSTSKLGLFTKGRASIPVTRKGLPDLSFSEMTFLKPHRDAQVEPSRVSGNKRLRTEKRATNVDDEISRFFEAAESPSLGREGNAHHRRAQPSPRRRSSSSLRPQLQHSGMTSSPMPSPSPLTNSFLGFGVPGPRPDISIRIGSTGRSSMSPSKHQLYQRPAYSGTPLTWSASSNIPSSISRPRNIIGSMSIHSERPEGKRTRPSRPGTERSAVQARSSPRTQFSRRQEHHVGKKDSPSTLAKSAQPRLNSRSTNATKVQEQTQAESCLVTDSEQHPPAIDTSTNVNHPLAQTAESTLNTLASETQNDSVFQPAIVQEDSNNEADPVDKPRTTDDIEASEMVQPEDPATLSQFAADLNKLLGEWKGKVTIPDDLSRGIQLPGINGSNIDNQDFQVRENQEPDHSIGAVARDAAVDINERQATLYLAQGQRPATNETFSTKAQIPSERDRVPSRISRARSQRSWIDPRSSETYRYQGDAQSPFQDSTYSTCGTRSIYEQQMQELPFDRQFDRGVHRNVGRAVFTDTQMIHHPVAGRPNIEPAPLPLRRQRSTQSPFQLGYDCGHDEPEDVQYPVFNAPVLRSGVMESSDFDRGRSIEASYHLQGWLSPTRSCHQMELYQSPALHHNSPRNHFPRHAFGDEATAEAEMYYALEDPEHSEGMLEAGDATREDADEELVGFWKPHRLY